MEILSTVIKNPQGKIKFKRFSAAGTDYYHIGVWINASKPELRTIDKVEYELHKSFKNRIRKSEARHNGFSVTFWAWGAFEIKVSIHKVDGTVEIIQHQLQIKLPADNGSNYIDVSA